MIKLSIITINRNNAQGLEKTLQSILFQTFTDFEVIVIDGNSTDNSLDIITNYANNITYWVSEPDNGIYDAMNKGIFKANGEYILFLNSGDFLLSKLTLFNVFYANYTQDFIFGVVDKEFGFRIRPPKTLTVYALIFDLISHQASFIRKSLFDELGAYDTNIKIVSDWYFLFLAISKYNKSYIVINEHIAFSDSQGVSGGKIGSELSAQIKYELIRKTYPLMFHDYFELHKYKRFTCRRIVFGIKRRLHSLALKTIKLNK